MQMTQGALGFLIKRYSAVLKKCRVLNMLGGLALAGALTLGGAGMAAATAYDPAGDFTADTSYDSTKDGSTDTVVVTKADGTISGTGTVTINAAKGLEINGVAGAGKLSVDADQTMSVHNGLTLTAGAVDATNNATLEIDNGGLVHVMPGEDGSATITGVTGGGGKAVINVINGSLGTPLYPDNLILTGPLAINVTQTTGHLICAGMVSLADGVHLTNGNDVSLNGIGSSDGQFFASLDITGDGTKYSGNLTVNDDLPNADPNLSITDGGILDGTLTVTSGSVYMKKGTAGATTIGATSRGGTLTVEGESNTMTSSLASLEVSGGTVDVKSGKLAVDGTLTLGKVKGTTFTLAKDAVLTAGKLASVASENSDKLNGGAVVNLNGTAEVANASKLVNGGFFVGGTLTMKGDLELSSTAGLTEKVRGAEMTVLRGGTLDMNATSILLTGVGSLEVKEGGTLKLAQGQTITVGGNDFGSSRTEADGNFVLYGTEAFDVGKIEGGVTLTDGTLKFNGDADISGLMSNAAADGKIFFKHDDAGSGKAGVLSVKKTLTYKGDNLELGDAAGTLRGGQLVLGKAAADEGSNNFTMTKGTLMSQGGIPIFGPDGYTVTGYTPGITVGDGTGTLTLTEDSTLNLYQSATRTSTVKADKIEVADGTMNVQRGNWEVTKLTTATGGTLIVGGITPGTGVAVLTITESLDTKSSGGTVNIDNGTLNLKGTVKTDNDNLVIADLGQVITDLGKAYANGALADDFGTVSGSGLLTLRNNTSITEMSLADYKDMTTALQGSNGKNVGVSVDNLTISGTDGATLDATPGTGKINVAGVTGLENVVASVSDATVDLDSRTDLKGLKVADSGTTITVGKNNGTVMTLKGDATNTKFDLDEGGKADLVLDKGSTLNLGTVAGDKTYGNLSGSVTLTTSNDKLNVVNGEFSTGDIKAAAANAGSVNAVVGAILTAGAIGDGAGNAVGSVNAIDGAINAASIATNSLSATNGTVMARGDITVTQALDGMTGGSLNNGTIYSTDGDVTLTNGASEASGFIIAEAGSINTTNANITAAGSELTLLAGKNINVGTGDINATSVAAGETITANNVTAANVEAKKLAATGNVAVDGGVLRTSEASSVGGTLRLTNAQALVGDLNVSDYAEVTGGSFTGANVTLGGNGVFLNGAQADMDALSLTGSNEIFVGSADDTVGGATLTVGHLNLKGGTLYIDPAWGLDSAEVAVGSFTDGTTTPDLSINGSVIVGMNSMATIGTTNKSWLRDQVNSVTNGAGLTENGVDSALGIYTAQVLANGKGMTVDGTQSSTLFTSPAANTLDFSGKSLLVVNADAALDPAGALSNATAGTANVADGAKLRIAGAKINGTYKVLGDNITTHYVDDLTNKNVITDSTAWTGANLSTDSRLVHLEKNADGTFKGALTSAASFMPKLDGELVKVVNNMALAGDIGEAGEMSDAKGVRFLNRAISENYLNNDAKAAKTIESAARMAVAGAVPQMTMAAANAAANAVSQRTSLAQPGGNAIQSMAMDGSVQTGASAGDAAKTGFAMWIMPLYQSSNGYGMKAGNFDMDFSGGLGGVAIGADYTFDNAIRAGITFNIGGGYATGSGDLNETTNSMNFWGVGAYAGWAANNFGLTADVNYTSTYNKLEQDLPEAMGMRNLKSDVTAWAISAGLRGEYTFATSVMDVTPHVGVRYMSLNTDEYDVKSEGTVLKGDAINQSIWTFPIGVAFSKQIETGNGWHFKPSLDLAVIPAAGDIDARSDVRFTGTGTKAELDTQTMDYMSYMGQAGLEFGNETTTLGVNYNIQLGAKSTTHGVFGTFRYEF